MARQHDIRLRRSSNANAIPTSGNLNLGELAINTADGALYFKKGDNTIITAADNTIFHIDSDASNSGADKKIGIGTTSPNYKLSVHSGTNDWPLHVKSTDDKAGIIIQDDDTTVYIGAQSSSAFLGTTAGTSVNNLNVNSNGNIGLGIVTANLQSAGKGIHIHDDDNSEIKFTNSSTGNQAGDGTALVTSTTNFSINNREAGSLIFGTSNLTRATITSSGNFGIGTTAPVSNLHVHAGGGGGLVLEANANTDIDFRYRSNGSNKYNVAYDASEGSLIWYDNVASTRRMTLSSAGNIGIGTSAPATKLHVANGSDTSDAVRISGGHASRYLAIRTFENNSLVGAGISLNASSSGGAFKFQTTSTDRMTIANDGKVGINDTSPQDWLEVGVTGARGGITISSATHNYPALSFARSSTATARIFITEPDATHTSQMYFQTSDASGSAPNLVTAMSIDENQYVGIGTTSPGYDLDVSGNIHSTAAYIDGYIYHTGDSDTYINYSTDNIILSAGGPVMHIKGSGRVGIGTSSPNAKLEILSDGSAATGAEIRLQHANNNSTDVVSTVNFANNAGSVAMIQGGTTGANNTGYISFFTDNAGSSSEKMRILANGNVGIGTSSASTRLHVKHDSDTSTGITIDNSNTGTGARSQVVLNSDAAQFVLYASGSNYSGVTGWADAGILSTSSTSSGGLILNAQSGGIKFQYGTTERMRIDTSGRVGIKNSSPSSQYFNTLVVGDTSGEHGITIQSSATSRGVLAFSDTDAANAGRYDGYIAYNHNSTYMSFHTNTGNEHMRIDASGKVGIGTTSPQDTLHVITDSSTTNAVVDVARIEATSSGTPAVGFGPVIDFRAERAAASSDSLGRVGFVSDLMTSTRVDGAFVIQTAIDGSYSEHVRVTSTGNTIFGGTSVGAAGAMSVKVDGSYTDLYLYGAGTSQGGRIFFGDSSDRSSIVGTYGTGGGGKLSFKTDTTGGTSLDRLVIDSDGSIRFNNAFTFPTSIGSAGQVLKVPNSGSVLIWADQTGGGGSTDSIADADGDTKIQVEESSDEDTIRFDVAGSQLMQISSNGVGINEQSIDALLHLSHGTLPNIKFERPGTKKYAMGISGTNFIIDGTNDNLSTPSLLLTTNGELCIGNSSAAAKLDIRQDSGYAIRAENGSGHYFRVNSTGAVEITHNDVTDALLLTTTEDSSSAGPVITLKRNSSTIADADYLGQLKFKGENDADQEIVYAKITAKIQDASDGSEDGLIEFANKKAGANVITARLRSDSLQLLNGTGLTVAGDATVTGNTTITGNLTVDGTTTTINTATLQVEDKDIVLNYGSGDTSATADGAGIIIQDAVSSSANAAIQWNTGNDRFNFTHGIRLPDSQKMQFGTGSDLEIQHNATNSSIVNNTGNLIIENASDDGDITFYTDNGSGGTTPYLTMDGGDTLTRVYKTMLFQDNVKASFGNSEDMRIKHDGSNGSIDNYTGDLLLRNNADDKDIVLQSDNGSGGLQDFVRIDGSGDRTIFSRSTRHNDGVVGTFGTGEDLQIYHDGTHSYISSTTGSLYARTGNTFQIENQNGSEDLATFAVNGAVVLYYDGVAKLATKSDGVDITGELQSDSLDVDGNADISGNLVVGGKETTATFPLMVKSDTSHQGLHIEENSGAESWQMGVDVDGDLNFYNSGSTTPSITFDDSNNVGIGEQPRFKVSIKTPAIPSGSSYAWPLDLSRPNTENRGLTFGIAASGTTNAIAGHNADVSIGHTYGTDSNGLPQYYETLRINHVDQNVGYIGIGETSPVHRVEAKGTDAAMVVHNDGNSRGGIVALASQLVGFTSTSVNDDLVFGHAGNPIASSAFNEKMRIDNGTGNVSIGTSGSGAKRLDILDAGDTNGEIIQIKGGSNYGAVITYHRSSSYSWEAGIGGGSSTEANIPASYWGVGERAASGRPARFLIAHTSGNVGIGVTPQTSGNVKLRVAGAVRIEEYTIDTTTTSTSATTQVAIHEFPIADFRTARFTIQITNTTDSTYHSTEIIAVHDGTTANITEFGEVHTGTSVEATFDADINTGNFRLLATPASTDSMSFKVVCHSITV